MLVKLIQKSQSDGTYQIEQSGGPPFRIAVWSLRRREDIEGLVHHGGEGGANPYGRVYEGKDGSLMVRGG